MKRLILLLAIIVSIAFADPGSQLIVPWADDIVLHTDSLHMTTAEKKWDIGNSFYVKIVNPTANTILIRFDTEAGESPSYIGNNTDGEFYFPSLLAAAFDSVCIKGSGAGTIYIEYWSNE